MPTFGAGLADAPLFEMTLQACGLAAPQAKPLKPQMADLLISVAKVARIPEPPCVAKVERHLALHPPMPPNSIKQKHPKAKAKSKSKAKSKAATKAVTVKKTATFKRKSRFALQKRKRVKGKSVPGPGLHSNLRRPFAVGSPQTLCNHPI